MSIFALHDPYITELTPEQVKQANQATHVYLGGCGGLKSVPAFPRVNYVDLRGCSSLWCVLAFPKRTKVLLPDHLK